MSKTTELEDLFGRWMSKQSSESQESLAKTMIQGTNISKDHFCKDGMICEKVFNQQKQKILFIAKEPNIADCEETKQKKVTSQIDDFIRYYETGKDDWRGRLRRNICKIYKVIINAEEKEDPSAFANCFAFLNLNKRGGAKSANDSAIIEYCKVYQKMIEEEITIIDPDLIVWLGLGTFRLAKDVFKDDIACTNVGYYYNLGDRKVPLIPEYHPSYFKISDEKRKAHIRDNLEKIGV